MGSAAVLGLSAIAFLVGALIPIQAATNAAMNRLVNDTAVVAWLMFATGLAFLSVWAVVARPSIPTWSIIRLAPPYAWCGGLVIACYVLSITCIAPKIGVGNAICLVVTGQIVSAVAIDNFGFFGAAVYPVSWSRIGGVLLMITGVFLARRV